MATFECNRCRRVVELDDADPFANARAIDCRCGGKMFKQFEGTSNEMRDMDNELGRDE